MALDIGAAARGHFSGCHAVGWDLNAPEYGDLAVGDGFQKHSYPLGIMVNNRGERFLDEGSDFRNYTYAKYGAEILAQPQQAAWGHRDYLGNVSSTLRDMNLRELALGTKGRSGQQWDIWEAVYSPVGEDGYPQRIWDKYTGEINPEVAQYWKENYDLAYIMKRDWASLGPKLKGKVHIYCGDMDNYYLNNAVYLTEEFLEETTDPYYDGEVDYGDRAEHCWNGDQSQPNHISRLRYHRMFIPKWTEEIKSRAPRGADLKSWRY